MRVLHHPLHLAHVIQENPRQRPVKRKLTPPEIPDHMDQEVEKLIDQAKITTTAQFYDKDWKDGLTEIGANPESPVKKTHVMWSNILKLVLGSTCQENGRESRLTATRDRK